MTRYADGGVIPDGLPRLRGLDFIREVDYGTPYDRCPHWHCHEPWHGLAITERMEEMHYKHRQAMTTEPSYETWDMDPDYRYSQDDSAVICPGSGKVCLQRRLGLSLPPHDLAQFEAMVARLQGQVIDGLLGEGMARLLQTMIPRNA